MALKVSFTFKGSYPPTREADSFVNGTTVSPCIELHEAVVIKFKARANSGGSGC